MKSLKVIYQNRGVPLAGGGCYEETVADFPRNYADRRPCMERLACRILLGREGRDWRILADDHSPANMRAETYNGIYALIVREC